MRPGQSKARTGPARPSELSGTLWGRSPTCQRRPEVCATGFAAILLIGLASLCGCRLLGPGYIGPIQSPPLDVPVQVNDLRAIEYGDQIIVAFTISRLTTEGPELRSLRSVDLYVGAAAGADDPNTWSRTALHYTITTSGATSAAAPAPGPQEYRFPVQAWIGKDVALRVRLTGSKGRMSLWSFPALLSVIAPIQRPTDLKAESRKDGVHLTWIGTGPKYRVLRTVADGMPEPLADTDKPEYLDDTAQFGMRYQYLVLALADEKRQSLASEPLAMPMTPVDVFPPDVPAGVTAVPGVNAIELEWERNTEADFKGYNVFRSVDGGPFEKVAPLIEAPTYSDTNVQSGKSYRYAISAVDLAGNESPRSEPVQAALP